MLVHACDPDAHMGRQWQLGRWQWRFSLTPSTSGTSRCHVAVPLCTYVAVATSTAVAAATGKV